MADIVKAVRKKLIRRLCRTGALSREDAANLLAWKNSGFSIHGEVCIQEWDREGLEHLVGYCSRPAISQARLIYNAKTKTVMYRTQPKEGKSELVAVILDDKELVRLLNHLGLPAEFPVFKPAAQASLYEHNCDPPDEQCQLDKRTDLYDDMDPVPAGD